MLAECSKEEFLCDNRCLPLQKKCNLVKDCTDGTDEENCPVGEQILNNFSPFFPLELIQCVIDHRARTPRNEILKFIDKLALEK